MSNETQHTPADVRERVAKIVREAMEDARRSERLNTFLQSSMWDYADRILALLRTPRGEGEAWRAFLDALDEYEAAANLWADPEGPTAVDMERLRQSRRRVIECAGVLAALRSEAQEGEEDALVCASCGEPIGDEPTVIWQGAYTHYRCTPEDAIRDDTPVIRPIDAARRGEGGGDGE